MSTTSKKNYEFIVREKLGDCSMFDDMEINISTETGTVLKSPVVDQAALHGIIARIRDLGLTLVSVKCKD